MKTMHNTNLLDRRFLTNGKVKHEPVVPNAEERNFDKLAQRYLEWIARQYPGQATYLGIHDQDDKLTDWSPKAVDARKAKLREFHQQFKVINFRQLDHTRRIEREMIINEFECQFVLEKNWPAEERDPSLFLDDAVYACYGITIRECGDAEESAAKMTARMLAIPRVLQQAQKLLTRPTMLNCEAALIAGEGAIAFFKDTVAKFAKRVKSAKTRQDMREAAQVAEDAVNLYCNWIKKEVLPTAPDDYAIGTELFNMLLAKRHQLEIDAEELLKLGQKIYRQTIKELEDTAKRIDPRFTWEQQIEFLKRDHPTNSELVQYYADEMKRAKRFVIERRLIDIPEGERIDVVPTPEFARGLIPYAAYIPPAPFEKEQRGVFWVTPVDRDKEPEEMEAQLRGHSTHGIVVTALHEAYPGHHLQISVSNLLNQRPLSTLLSSSTFCEGWALYCEQMMWETGFYDDFRSRLLQLKDQLWRACRVIIDVQLHTGGWSRKRAAQYLVEKAMLEEPNAEVEVRRYCLTPAYPMSYIVGKLELLDILADYKVMRGEAFNLRQFHNDLISHGSLPFKYIRQLMGLPKVAAAPTSNGKGKKEAAVARG
jgi:uncharacterized protein (DUF885 family)